jgi:ferredoxin
LWLLLGAMLLLLLALPLLPSRAPPATAKVDPANCNGCQRCFDDCPYAAITMVPHPNARAGRQLARVDAELCASCGICVGSCPSSTPFRSAAELVTGIDMPQMTLNDLRQQLDRRLAALTDPSPIVVIGCDRGANVATLNGAGVASLSLICTGMLPPSFVEYALRQGAAGVLVTGCREGGCEFRLGALWTRQRLLGQREPHLRASVPRDLVATVWAGTGEEPALVEALIGLQRRVARSSPIAPSLQHG